MVVTWHSNILRREKCFNFNDTVTVEDSNKPSAPLTGMDIAMTVHIDQAVQAHVDLTADGSNYMEVEGGGAVSS